MVGGVQPRGPRDVPMPGISIVCLFRGRMDCAVELGGSGIAIESSSDGEGAFGIPLIALMSGNAAEDERETPVVSDGVGDIEL